MSDTSPCARHSWWDIRVNLWQGVIVWVGCGYFGYILAIMTVYPLAVETRLPDEVPPGHTLRMAVVHTTGTVTVDSDRLGGACVIGVSSPRTLAVPTGNPIDGQELRYLILAEHPQPLYLVSGERGFAAAHGFKPPPTTPAGGELALAFRWDAQQTRWGLMAVLETMPGQIDWSMCLP